MRLKLDFFYCRNKCCCGFASPKKICSRLTQCYMSHILKLEENNRKGKKIHAECHETTEAEVGVIHLQAKEHQGLPATTRSQEGHGTILKSPGGTNPANTLIVGFWPEL